MKEIILITTKGCEGCAIMRNSINQALALSNKDIVFEEKDVENIDKKKLFNLSITDCPTTLFIKNGIILRREVGTRPCIVVLRWIDIDFK